MGGVTTHYIYDLGGNLIAEADGGTGAASAEYVALEGKPLAYIATGSIYWVHGDHLGTPQVLTDAAGAAVWDATYRPFGEATVTGALTFNLRFPGQYEDAETGLHYNYFRDYDPATGRYIQSDPIGLQGGWNTYAYVRGNPVTWEDPEGLLRTSPGPYTGTSSTVVCDGSGGIRPLLNHKNPCIIDCVVRHEGVHIVDALRWKPNICEGKPDGTRILFTPKERKYTEIGGFREELNCVLEKLRYEAGCCRRSLVARKQYVESELNYWTRK